MKIGLVCPYDLFAPGGVREHVLALYQEFKRHGHLVKIISPKTKKSPNPDFLLLGRSVKFPSTTGSWGRISSYFANKKLEEILNRENFDLLHFHEPLVPFLSWQLLFSSSTVNLATFHSAWEDSISLIANFEFLIKPFAEIFAKKIDGFIAVSSVAQQCWQKFFSQNMVVIPNGIDLTCFHPQVKPFRKYQDKKTNLLFVGRLEKRKGVIYLLRAFEKIKTPSLRLILVGSGTRKIEAEFFVRSHHLENVEFVGRVSKTDLPRYYATADICCFPSIGGESFGIVLLEAMASAKPIVCFANPGYQEVLKHYPYREGLVPAKDVDGLEASLRRLMGSKSLRKKLGQWGLKEAQKYSWPKISQQVLAYYQKVLS